MTKTLILITVGLGALFTTGPATARGDLCTPQAAGEQSCRQARLCECQYFPGGLLGGPGEYRWDCGVQRPSCGTVGPVATELEGVRDFVRSVLAQDDAAEPVKLSLAPQDRAKNEPFAGLLAAVAGLGPLPDAPAREEPRVYRQAGHGLDQVAEEPAVEPAAPAPGRKAWRMAKAPIASAGDRFAQLEAAAEDESRRLELRIARLEAKLAAERDENTVLRARVEASDTRFAKLTGRLEDMRAGHQSALDRMTGRAYLTVGTLEEAVAMTGLDLRALLGDGKAESGLGGPFVPAGALDAPDPVIAMENAITVLGAQMTRWEQLHDLLSSLPLSAPLDHYRVTSHFGPRRDPVNGRDALHKGIDLKAPSGTPVLATAPGRVYFAGWRGRFGRTVEIDHGYGLRTRYAHLRKIMVKRGEPVGHRQAIGLLGSSGRSTGPHVHYEIMAESGQLDPGGFFEAGLHLFKGPGPQDERTAEVVAE